MNLLPVDYRNFLDATKTLDATTNYTLDVATNTLEVTTNNTWKLPQNFDDYRRLGGFHTHVGGYHKHLGGYHNNAVEVTTKRCGGYHENSLEVTTCESL